MSGFRESALQKDQRVDERTDRSEFIGSLRNAEIEIEDNGMECSNTTV